MPKTLKTLLKPLGAIVLALGFDPRRLSAIKHAPKYIAGYRAFKKMGGTIAYAYPIVSDFDDQAGSASGHYFHQDLLVASLIHDANPTRHIDIGSRIDGFVAHVASFRKIEVMDVRKLRNTTHPNISFLQANLMDAGNAHEHISDSISCLHAIEHFGLGRYGDPIDPNGHTKGFNNIVRMLKPGGVLYISFPIGKTNEVYFNAHRVFHPRDIFSWPNPQHQLDLVRFDYVDDNGDLHRNADVKNAAPDVEYGCGIYTFRKL